MAELTDWKTSSKSTNGAQCVQVAYNKSQLSSDNMGGCVEVGFKKAEASSINNQCVEVGFSKAEASVTSASCVEVGFKDEEEFKDGEEIVVFVRDSKDPKGPVLKFTAKEWDAFVGDKNGGVKGGEFDLPANLKPETVDA